uniref:Uncharacterized protein n=1 Tax=Zea mays TaxID=4577 RepID=A0A804N4X3_MAIZE
MHKLTVAATWIGEGDRSTENELDVNITWEDILQDEHNKGIFDMELEDLAEDEHNLGRTSVET